MSHRFILLIIMLLGSVFLMGIEVYEEDLYREYIQLQVSERGVLAFPDRHPSAAVDLETGEDILLSEEKGYVGAVVTNRRFLAISSLSGKWLSEPLEHGEENNADLKLGEKIAMLITDKRVIGFTFSGEGFVEYDLPFGSDIAAEDAGENFGIVAMRDRAVGLSSETGRFREMEYEVGETFESLEMATTLALVYTEDNIYSYRGSSGTWSIREKPRS